MSRSIEQLLPGIPTVEGNAVKLTRLLAQALQQRLDPFLMLDHFDNDEPNDYVGGFPNHPHRGFETITYLLAGAMQHSDSTGHTGTIQAGDVQWMCAGRGVVHSEMPQQNEGRLAGFQLWLNLPATEKMQTPWYKDLLSDTLPRFETEQGVKGCVIAGECHQTNGAIQRPFTEPLIVDLHLPANSQFTTDLPASHNAFFVVYEGVANVQGEEITPERLAILRNDADDLTLSSNEPTKLLLIAGKPLKEPIARYGPFVMNTPYEIQQAITEYRSGEFGDVAE